MINLTSKTPISLLKIRNKHHKKHLIQLENGPLNGQEGIYNTSPN